MEKVSYNPEIKKVLDSFSELIGKEGISYFIPMGRRKMKAIGKNQVTGGNK